MAQNIKKFSDDKLYECLYQSSVDECDIPKKRKDRISLLKKVRGNFRIHPLRHLTSQQGEKR